MDQEHTHVPELSEENLHHLCQGPEETLSF